MLAMKGPRVAEELPQATRAINLLGVEKRSSIPSSCRGRAGTSLWRSQTHANGYEISKARDASQGEGNSMTGATGPTSARQRNLIDYSQIPPGAGHLLLLDAADGGFEVMIRDPGIVHRTILGLAGGAIIACTLFALIVASGIVAIWMSGSSSLLTSCTSFGAAYMTQMARSSYIHGSQS